VIYYYYNIMIIIFSLIILFILIFIGMNQKEGMTLSNSSLLINILNTYYSKKTNNSDNNISNNTNEINTISAINKLNLTDPSFVSILTNNDLDNSSQINLIKTMMTNNISQNMSDSISIDTFNQMIPYVTINNATETQAAQNITELKNLVSSDSRFSKLLLGDPIVALNNVLTKMANLINPL